MSTYRRPPMQRATSHQELSRHYARRRKQKKRRRAAIVLSALLVLILVAALLLSYFILRGNRSGYEPGDAPPGPPYVVALDAGHGGSDVGAAGIINEVELTESTVSHLLALLQNDPSYSPVLCRELGKGATISERARKANAAGASLLVSIHGNSDESGEGRGFECFPAPPGRKWHEQSLAFATAAANRMGQAQNILRGENGVRYVYYETADDESQKVFREASDTAEYDQPTFGILEKADCPAVLVEQCFVTNPSDVDLFAGDNGCYIAAVSYYRAICDYYGTTPLA